MALDPYEVDPIFGPPATMGANRGATACCKPCDVYWEERVLGWNCWVCGKPGIREHKYVVGTTTAYVDEPPSHMWHQLGWTPNEEGVA